MSQLIGYIIYALDRHYSGIGQYTRRLLEALGQAGQAPLVLRSGGWPPGFQQADYHSVRLPGTNLLPSLLTVGQAQIGWHARRQHLGLVHDPTGTVPLGLCPCKQVATICDTIPYIYPQVSTALDRLIYRYWLPRAVRNLDMVITISQQSKNDLEQYLKIPRSKTVVIPLAAGSKFRVMGEAEIAPALERAGVERPYLLYVGSVEPRKNLLRLLDAFQELLQWSQRWRLVIVGARNYWKSSPVAQKVEQLGLQGQVIFTGYIPDEDLPALYNGADLFCFPSLYEGFGLPVLEAMACGVPVVTSNCSSLPEVAGDAAILVDPYNVAEITSAMRRVLEDTELAQWLRDKGQERARQFSWAKTAQETIAVYEKVLGGQLF